MDELILQRDMTDSQRMMFQSEISKVRKDKTTALLLTFFLGGVGAHHYYMGNVAIGVMYTLFCWTFVPAIAALVELFMISGRVERYNAQQAQEIAVRVKMLASPAAA